MNAGFNVNTHRVVTGNIIIGRTVHGVFDNYKEAQELQEAIPNSTTESYMDYGKGNTSPIKP